jgi:transposase
MKAYSQDLRDRVTRAIERGESPSEIARRLEVSRVWIYRVRDALALGRTQPKQVGGWRRSRLVPHEPAIREWIGGRPDLTLREIADRLHLECAVTIGITALWQQLDKWGITYKKNPTRKRATTPRRAAGPE